MIYLSQNSIGELFNQEKEKTMEVGNLYIKGQLLQWEDVIIQISNISLITTANVQPARFPLLSLLILLIGLLLFSSKILIASIVLLIGVAWIALWYQDYSQAKSQKFLRIYLNSGRAFSLLFKNETFLNRVMEIFANIFEEGNDYSHTNISIDIANCQVDNQSSIIGSIHEK